MLIRKMNRGDVPQCAAIEQVSINPPWREQDFYDTLEQETLMMVAESEPGEESGKRILGYINMYISFGEGEITNVAVDPAQRGKGIAWEMMQAFMKEAGKQSVERIVLEVRVSNKPAIGLYQKLGFVSLGIRKNFYEQPREDAMIMELNLC